MGHRSDVLHGRDRDGADARPASPVPGGSRWRSGQGRRARWRTLDDPDPADDRRADEVRAPHSDTRTVCVPGADGSRWLSSANPRTHRAGPTYAEADHRARAIPASDCDCHSGSDLAAGSASSDPGAFSDPDPDRDPSSDLAASSASDASGARPDPDPDADPDCGTDPDADPDCGTDPDADPDCGTDPDADPHRGTDPDRGTDPAAFGPACALDRSKQLGSRQ